MENTKTLYKFIFEDIDGVAYFLERDPNSKTNFVYLEGLQIHPAKEFTPSLLARMGFMCKYPLPDWSNFSKEKLQTIILAMKADPYDQDCMTSVSQVYFKRP